MAERMRENLEKDFSDMLRDFSKGAGNNGKKVC